VNTAFSTGFGTGVAAPNRFGPALAGFGRGGWDFVLFASFDDARGGVTEKGSSRGLRGRRPPEVHRAPLARGAAGAAA
jgi:hypothetical protein